MGGLQAGSSLWPGAVTCPADHLLPPSGPATVQEGLVPHGSLPVDPEGAAPEQTAGGAAGAKSNPLVAVALGDELGAKPSTQQAGMCTEQRE